ncbi:integrase arm-type DNA-binding domain-containing protein [Sphingomonas sp. ST-64]|uniref:Integrase arm-type DNA-binding domain-containing protein n=1 Tax=Sphingomonas plantiphila TaxID=3163295 RepID=A0ABW8YHU7_9SPHN
MALTDLELRALQPRDRIYKKTDERGLYIEVHPNGSKLWRFKYGFRGKDKRLALGRYPEITLAEARERQEAFREKIRDGVDPITERKRQTLARSKAPNTFGEVAKEYLQKMNAQGRAQTTTAKAGWLLEQLRSLHDRPIADLKPVDVLAVLKRIEAKGKLETARRCRSFAGRVFRYGFATGRAESDPTSLLRGALMTPKTKPHAAILDPKSFGELLRNIDSYSGHRVTKLAACVSAHAMTRPGEMRKALWAEIDLEKSIWKIPASRSQMGRTHSVPLSQQVRAYFAELHELTGPDGFVFPALHTSRRPLSENTVNQAFRRMGYAAGEVTAYGLRTTVSTLLRDSGKWSTGAIEHSLARANSGVAGGVDNRVAYWEERVAMYQWWSDYLDTLKTGKS